MANEETITLYDVDREWYMHASGKDEHGCIWTAFEVDTFADQFPGECSICGAEIMEGFQCLDGGEEVCHAHVQYAEDLV